ncbi:MAG: 3-dehydroquinate synthase [Anaerohalosphaeraceae bacterium]
MNEIQVKVPATPEGGYPIVIGTGILSGLLERIEREIPNKALFIVTDESLAKAGHLATLTGGREVPSYVIRPAGEESKHFGTLAAILEAMEAHRLGRDTVVIGLGGGTVGDIAGFAAAVFKRGVPVVHIPTTTVAQADSSIGGKTGVDSTQSKNAFGCFWHPAAVFIDTATLATLDERQYRAGLAESVKHAAIANPEYFAFLENHIDAILRRDTDVLGTVAGYNCLIKAAVVEEDPTEKNKRRILNYGHTVGHAVESASQYQLLHGECVAIGMMAAGMLERAMGLADDGRMERIEGLLKKLGLPTRIGGVGKDGVGIKKVDMVHPTSEQIPTCDMNIEHLLNLLTMDKKAVGKWPRFVLLERLGQVYCRDGQWAAEVRPEVVKEVVSDLLKK